jgi:serine/threonine protein kinase
VSSLLAADGSADEFLRDPAVGLGWAILADERLFSTVLNSEPTPSASADLVGTDVAGRYQVIQRLDDGGFGEVYKALDPKVMSRPVVIKVLKDDALREGGKKKEWLLTKFRQEIEALSKIQDPGVVGIFDADTLPDGRPYLVMEFVRGSNLRNFIKQANEGAGLQFMDVAEIVRQVGRALTAAHDEDIIHRDLKPENIMLRRNTSGDLQVKVIDFGIAKVRNSLIAPSTATGLFIAGTWLYMAPEQLLGKKVDAACDIYALGVIAYELVTGRYPFPAKDSAKLKEMQEAGIKVKPCDLNPDLSTDAQKAILKALRYYPAERHKRARDFGDELARALASDEELVRPVSPPKVDLEGKTLGINGDSKRNESEESVIVQSQPIPSRTLWLRLHKHWIYAVSIALLTGIVSLAVWRLYRTSEPQLQQQQRAAATQIAGTERTLTYWLSIQRPRDKEPFESIGNVVYDAGSKFWFNVQTTQDGALYLFGEGHNGSKVSDLNTIFPTPVSGKGDARIAADMIRRVNENPNEFRNDSGVIYLWIVWAAQPVPLLDEIVKDSYKTRGTIRDPSQQAALRAFIKQYGDLGVEVTEDDLRSRVLLKGRSEILLDMRKLKYQP